MSDIYFGTSTSLNRVSFLRSDSKFVSSLISGTGTTRLTFYVQGDKNDVAPVLVDTEGKSKLLVVELASLPAHLIAVLEQWAERNDQSSVDVREEITAVFLGLDETGAERPHLFSSNPLDSQLRVFGNSAKGITRHRYNGYEGVAYLAVDITRSQQLKDYLFAGSASDGAKAYPGHSMMSILGFEYNEAALFGYGKTYLDWLMRNQRCPGCGSVVIPQDAGTRLYCTSGPDQSCPVKRTSVNNVCFPRSDPVVIIGVVSADGSKTLLGHNRRHAADPVTGVRMFSTIAGFMEPGETIEEASIREIWEETGCKASAVKIINSQPWPFPASLMIGCVAEVEFNGVNEVINIEHDKEMEEVKWIDTALIKDITESEDLTGKDGTEAEKIRLPFRQSIAYSLISKIAHGE
ncbi:unnamed protein product [Kuraishia capsulata CBS 1993]|uniref:NAD(+) diphosphatase n=1 Tax=Kuraishia capsulata CBS 1993 TaxID=1382522 RepID=W6MPB9_9ASCO|nr:uncharacterized protein KUCA_T00004492001 [Kuraishia capsulata CBS 1993]CDK28509.1 unnamed protein product [Kuraishia capsulata CBS 1993]